MLFAMFFTPKAGTPEERVALTRNWKFPAGLRSVAWYHFPASSPRWIEIVEADSVAVLMEMARAFDPYYDITVLPTETGSRASN